MIHSLKEPLKENPWNKKTNIRLYDHPIVRTHSEQKVNLMKELLNGQPVSRALEVGCGDGFGIYYIRSIVENVYGCDMSLPMLKRNPVDRKYLCKADANYLPYADVSFDLVYCWEVLEYISNPLKVVKEMKRVSSKYVLISMPNCLNPAFALFGLSRRSERGLLRFTPWYLKRLMMQADIHNIRVSSVSTYTPNQTPLWLFRILSKLPYKWPLIGMYNVAIGEVKQD